jgi:signal transduction histidine kinase
VKYSKVGAKVEMNIKSENKRTIFVIKDYGRGIDDADLKHIFDRFYRADKSRHTQGYGLGLSIAQKIVIANKGQIVVKSIKNVGTKVSISLPSVG